MKSCYQQVVSRVKSWKRDKIQGDLIPFTTYGFWSEKWTNKNQAKWFIVRGWDIYIHSDVEKK